MIFSLSKRYYKKSSVAAEGMSELREDAGFLAAYGLLANASDGEAAAAAAAAQPTEEYHGNGVLRFTSAAGEKLLAFTHKLFSEVWVE